MKRLIGCWNVTGGSSAGGPGTSVAVPKIVAYFSEGSDNENFEPDWECPNCGFGVAEDYVTCPHCGSELNWSLARKPSKTFKKFMARL